MKLKLEELINWDSKNPVRMAIDVHGVMDTDPDDLKLALEQAIKTGLYEVYVISGPPQAQVKAELDGLGYKHGIHYNYLYTIVDYLRYKGANMWQGEDGTWWASDEDWWSTKANICKELEIDFLVDNTDKYKPYFANIKTKFLQYE